MRRSTIIASCLVNSKMIDRLEIAEAAIRYHFSEEFPQASFERWNREVDDDAARRIISNVGHAMTINVKRFIEDLGDPLG